MCLMHSNAYHLISTSLPIKPYVIYGVGLVEGFNFRLNGREQSFNNMHADNMGQHGQAGRKKGKAYEARPCLQQKLASHVALYVGCYHTEALRLFETSSRRRIQIKKAKTATISSKGATKVCN